MVRLRKFQSVPTTIVDRLLLICTIGVLPLQWYYPTLFGLSVGFIVFAVSGAYVVSFRLRMLRKILLQPLFWAGYAFVSIGFFMEVAHGSTGYVEMLRILFMILGATIVAVLCRDRKAFLWAICGYLLAGICLSCILFLTSYGTLRDANARDFQDASYLRQSIFDSYSLDADANTIAFFAAQGVVVSVGMGLMAKSYFLRGLFIALGAFCLVATSLPMSRGSIVIVAISCAAMVWAHGLLRPKVIIAATVLAVATMMYVPDVVFKRLTVSVETRPGEREEGRKRVYGAVLQHLPEYIFTGVGITNYYGKWGRQTRLWKNNRVLGTHNSFAQVTVYWGMVGLLALLTLIWQAYRCLPSHLGTDYVRLCLLGIVVSVAVEMLFVHTLYIKPFSLALGLLAGWACWVEPRFLPQSAPLGRRPSRPVGSMSPPVPSVGVSRL